VPPTKKTGMPGMPVKCKLQIKKTALPGATDTIHLYHCACLVPHVATRLSAAGSRVFLNPVAPGACFGREKGACDQAPEASADRSDFLPGPAGISAPLAGRNLHLVILPLWQDSVANSPLFCLNYLRFYPHDGPESRNIHQVRPGRKPSHLLSQYPDSSPSASTGSNLYLPG